MQKNTVTASGDDVKNGKTLCICDLMHWEKLGGENMSSIWSKKYDNPYKMAKESGSEKCQGNIHTLFVFFRHLSLVKNTQCFESGICLHQVKYRNYSKPTLLDAIGGITCVFCCTIFTHTTTTPTPTKK
jgi:hypothetical protein